MPYLRTVLISALLLSIPATGLADEAAELLKRIDPPARFARHRAKFTLDEKTFTFRNADGSTKTKTWKVIRDDGKIIGLYTGNTFHMLTFQPGEGLTDKQLDARMPRGRWHIDTMLGTLYGTGAFFHGQKPDEKDLANVNFRDDFLGEGTAELTLVRRFKGSRPIRRQRPDRKPGQSKYEEISQKLDTTNTFVLRVDPVTGYVIDGTFDNAVSPAPQSKQYVNLMEEGTYALWPGQARNARSVITRKGHEGWQGYAHNLKAFDLCDNDRPVIRDGGFAAFLDDKTGWSSCMTLAGADARMSVCNAHADIDFIVDWPKDLKPNADGLTRLVIKHRLLSLPPEVTKHIWEKMELRYKGLGTVTIRMGEMNDFEGEPTPATEPVRGIINTSGLKLAEKGRSGSRSLLVQGTVWPNLPQVALQPETRYRMEAWLKVRKLTAEELAARKARHESWRQKQIKRGKTDVPGWSAPTGPAKAYITGYFYEWSPHSNVWLKKLQTNTVTSDSEEWQKVELEFTTPSWDPFIDIRFHCENGVACVDDFILTPLPAPKD